MMYLRTIAVGFWLLAMGVVSVRGADTGRLDRRDLEHPLMQRAQTREMAGDYQDAVELYIQAVEKHPGLARAHLDAAILLHDREQEYVEAIYHYGRYLAKRPETEKREMVESRIRLAKLKFAASICSLMPMPRPKAPVPDPLALQ